ncbi:hypothetical protein NFX46_25855 [Streptomyces phaeoluteigriseus]|uniref:Uncharacterized protein n=1 Tax=Streptomyces phaeoluteigriseus TaxID=114686 RepID=A0ABY4ZCW4_9ACTN|nr:hypothetical protein [Streptomyces phaeoluteigriseus]USQ86826.1 hypothetical protein NFX46_25855 [Streptomyces phaeoluteigriseus]
MTSIAGPTASTLRPWLGAVHMVGFEGDDLRSNRRSNKRTWARAQGDLVIGHTARPP